jgi:hypothetical protein
MGDLSVSAVYTSQYLALCGYILAALGLWAMASRQRSVVLGIGSLAFAVCAFATGAAATAPIRFVTDAQGKVISSAFPPHWLGWLLAHGVPVALLVVGVCLALHAVRSRRLGT